MEVKEPHQGWSMAMFFDPRLTSLFSTCGFDEGFSQWLDRGAKRDSV